MQRTALSQLALFLASMPMFGQIINTTLRSHVGSTQIRRYGDLWADGNLAFLGSDQGSGVLIYDITNPDAPVLKSNYAPSNSLDMEDVKAVNGIGYFASYGNGGIHIVN